MDVWNYKLGNRCPLEWVLDQYKEKNPKTPSSGRNSILLLRRLQGKGVDLLARVTTVSVETVRITKVEADGTIITAQVRC